MGGKKNPEPDQETLCRDGDAVNRQRILTIAASWNRDAKGRGHSALAVFVIGVQSSLASLASKNWSSPLKIDSTSTY